MNPAVIALIVQYGPEIAGLLVGLLPAIEKAKAAGATHDQAVRTVVDATKAHLEQTDWAANVRGFPDGSPP